MLLRWGINAVSASWRHHIGMRLRATFLDVPQIRRRFATWRLFSVRRNRNGRKGETGVRNVIANLVLQNTKPGVEVGTVGIAPDAARRTAVL